MFFLSSELRTPKITTLRFGIGHPLRSTFTTSFVPHSSVPASLHYFLSYPHRHTFPLQHTTHRPRTVIALHYIPLPRLFVPHFALWVASFRFVTFLSYPLPPHGAMSLTPASLPFRSPFHVPFTLSYPLKSFTYVKSFPALPFTSLSAHSLSFSTLSPNKLFRYTPNFITR